MSWGAIAVGAGVTGLGLQAYGAYKGQKGGGYNYNPYGNLNPEQIALTQKLGPLLSGALGPAQQYTGQYNAPMTQGEQNVISTNARLSALGAQGLEPMLRGEFPEQYYQDAIKKPIMKTYEEEIRPLIQEQYSGPGEGYWGSARAGAVTKGYRDVLDTLTASRAELGYLAQQGVPAAMDALNRMSATSAQVQELPRLIQDYGLQQKYAEWKRTRPENMQYIDWALEFLGLSTGTAEYQPLEDNKFTRIGSLLTSVGGIASGFNTGGGSQAVSQYGNWELPMGIQ